VRKRILIIVVILFWGAVLLEAIHYFSTKFIQEAIDKDNQRLFDISVNDYHIAKYYTDHEKLPDNFAEIVAAEKNESKSIVPPVVQDPEKKTYAYAAVSDDTYQICTEFSTDTLHNRNLADDYTEYITIQLGQYAKSVYHKKGYDCIQLSMEGNPVAKKDSSYQPEVFTFVKPANNDRACLGSDYTLAWKGDPNTDTLGIYLVPPPNMNQVQSWLKNGYEVSPGQLVRRGVTKSRLLEGSFDWKVGALEAYVGAAAPQPVKPGAGYQLGVVTSTAGTEHTYSSDYFEIADCNVASASASDPQADTNN
jgi:hypothetical protein